jgi:hypothetical protein
MSAPVKLTTNDRRFLARNFIQWEDLPSEQEAYGRLLRRNLELLDEKEELLYVNLALTEEREAWYRRCSAVSIALACVAVLWLAREIFLAGGYL